MNNVDLYNEKASIKGYQHAYDAVLELERYYRGQFETKEANVWLQDSGVCIFSFRAPVV